MLFRFGLSVVIFVAVYLYWAISNHPADDINKDNIVINDTEKFPTDGKQVKLEDVVPIESEESKEGSRLWKSSLHLAVVSCGDRLEESLVMMKSAVLFSRSHLIFHIFTETQLESEFQQRLDFWPPKYRERIQYHIHNLTFPSTDMISAEEWKKLFKPCACQRLFIPELLQNVDSLLYVDTDVLFLSPVDEIWTLFSKFNSTQLAGLVPEHEDRAAGWYNRFARHPYYGELGLNSGVMLMNLTRLRASSWLNAMNNYYTEYRLKITFGDQDLINIYFHFYPEQLYVFTCEWNYRPDHCMYMSVCKPAEVTGAYVLHGCRRVWHEDKQPAFKAVYQAFKEHRLGDSLQFELLDSVKKNLKSTAATNCGRIPEIFFRQIEAYINSTATEHNRV